MVGVPAHKKAVFRLTMISPEASLPLAVSQAERVTSWYPNNCNPHISLRNNLPSSLPSDVGASKKRTP